MALMAYTMKDPHSPLGAKGWMSRRNEVQDGTEAKQIRTVIDGVAIGLFR